MKKIKFLTALLFFVSLFSVAYAGIINYGVPIDKRWKEGRAAQEAYRPSPVVFSHGFASGGPLETWVEREKQKESEKPKLDEKLEPYYRNYYYGHMDPITKKPILVLKDTTRFPYLELVSYIDFSQSKRSQLIDRNSSIDTYKMGDYYVYNYERNPGDPGWADKLNGVVEKIRENYTDSNGYAMKIDLVCHSMGGLVAREYISNPKYGNSHNNVRKVIMTGVPNLGSPWASLANGLTTAQKAGWFIPWIGWVCSSAVAGLDKVAEETGMIDTDGDAARDMDASILGSGFLKGLNNRVQPSGVEYYVIWGNNRSFKDRIIGSVMYQGAGDGVVSKDSQLGTGVLNLKGAVEITASHGTEVLEISKLEALEVDRAGNAKPLLKFIDSAKPELKITSPEADKIMEIYENTISIKGEVRRENFPADSVLKIEVVREKDGNCEEKREGKLLYASDLWCPGDSDSVVAEFEEVLNFSQEGIYKISCELENPAGVHSDKKEAWVKVVKVSGTNIIIHCYNPEGKEINSIEGVGSAAVIYDGDKFLSYGAQDAQTYKKPIRMDPGAHHIKVTFNGMELSKDINLKQNETQELNFVFPRTEFDHRAYLDAIGTISRTQTIGPQRINSPHNIGLFDEDIPNLSAMLFCEVFKNIDLYITVTCSMAISAKGIQVDFDAVTEAASYPDEFIAYRFWIPRLTDVNSNRYWGPDYYLAIPGFNFSTFNRWFIQKNGGATNGNCAFGVRGVNLVNAPGYSIATLPPSADYARITLSDINPYYEEGFPVVKKKAPSKGIFTNDKVWVVSVPYDLLGTAVGE